MISFLGDFTGQAAMRLVQIFHGFAYNRIHLLCESHLAFWVLSLTWPLVVHSSRTSFVSLSCSARCTVMLNSLFSVLIMNRMAGAADTVKLCGMMHVLYTQASTAKRTPGTRCRSWMLNSTEFVWVGKSGCSRTYLAQNHILVESRVPSTRCLLETIHTFPSCKQGWGLFSRKPGGWVTNTSPLTPPRSTTFASKTAWAALHRKSLRAP
jgi:hypothetical protein